MSALQLYILIAIVTLAMILGLLVVTGRMRQRATLSPLTLAAMALIVVGVAFDSRLIAYSLMGAGVLMAVVDVVIQRKS